MHLDIRLETHNLIFIFFVLRLQIAINFYSGSGMLNVFISGRLDGSHVRRGCSNLTIILAHAHLLRLNWRHTKLNVVSRLGFEVATRRTILSSQFLVVTLSVVKIACIPSLLNC